MNAEKISHLKLYTSATTPLRIPSTRRNKKCSGLLTLPPTTCFRLAASAAKLAAAAATLPPPRCHRHAATATLPLPTPPPCCRRHQRWALAKLPPPPPSWLPLPTLHSCQAAATAVKLAAAPALSPHFRRHRHPLRFHRYCHCCHLRCFRAFSWLLIVCAPVVSSLPPQRRTVAARRWWRLARPCPYDAAVGWSVWPRWRPLTLAVLNNQQSYKAKAERWPRGLVGCNCPAEAMPFDGMVWQYLIIYNVDLLLLTNECQQCGSTDYALGVAHNTSHYSNFSHTRSDSTSACVREGAQTGSIFQYFS